MNRYELLNEVKNTTNAYIFWILVGAHYAYMGRWGIQIIFWITLGGMGFWWFIDLIRIPGIVRRHNAPIFHQLEQLDKIDNLERKIDKL